MAKFFVRITIIMTSIYFMLSFYLAQFYGIDILHDYHTVLFELCVVIYAFSEGKYHCRYLRFLALGILLSDFLSRLDNSFNFLSVSEHNAVGFCCITTGMGMTLYEAINHFYNVNKLKQKRAMLNERNTNSETTREHE